MGKLGEYLGNNYDIDKIYIIVLRLEMFNRYLVSFFGIEYGIVMEMEDSEVIVYRCIGLLGLWKGFDFYCG